MDDTHSYLLDGLTRDRPTVGKNPDGEGTRGAASPPPLCAPVVGAGAGTPRDPVAESFKELWAAYAFKQDRKKAKDAYKNLNPDATLHAQMVAAAGRWASSYKDNETDPRWYVRLHNWIGDENWDADPPLPYEPPQAAAIASKRGSKAKAKPPAADTRKPYTARGGKSPAKPAADTRKPTAAPGKAKRKPPATPYVVGLRPVKPGKALSYTQGWLGKQVAGGVLASPG